MRQTGKRDRGVTLSRLQTRPPPPSGSCRGRPPRHHCPLSMSAAATSHCMPGHTGSCYSVHLHLSFLSLLPFCFHLSFLPLSIPHVSASFNTPISPYLLSVIRSICTLCLWSRYCQLSPDHSVRLFWTGTEWHSRYYFLFAISGPISGSTPPPPLTSSLASVIERASIILW